MTVVRRNSMQPEGDVNRGAEEMLIRGPENEMAKWGPSRRTASECNRPMGQARPLLCRASMCRRTKREKAALSAHTASARRITNAYGRWGKGVHSASLNYGDCFAHEVAIDHDCPLHYVHDDFAQTNVRPAL